MKWASPSLDISKNFGKFRLDLEAASMYGLDNVGKVTFSTYGEAAKQTRRLNFDRFTEALVDTSTVL